MPSTSETINVTRDVVLQAFNEARNAKAAAKEAATTSEKAKEASEAAAASAEQKKTHARDLKTALDATIHTFIDGWEREVRNKNLEYLATFDNEVGELNNSLDNLSDSDEANHSPSRRYGSKLYDMLRPLKEQHSPSTETIMTPPPTARPRERSTTIVGEPSRGVRFEPISVPLEDSDGERTVPKLSEPVLRSLAREGKRQLEGLESQGSNPPMKRKKRGASAGKTSKPDPRKILITRTVTTDQVEGRHYAFEYEKSGAGIFVILCQGVADGSYPFDRAPLLYHKAEKHLKDEKTHPPDSTCQHKEGKLSRDELMERFGSRVTWPDGTDVGHEWMNESNELIRLEKRPVPMLAKGKAKAKRTKAGTSREDEASVRSDIGSSSSRPEQRAPVAPMDVYSPITSPVDDVSNVERRSSTRPSWLLSDDDDDYNDDGILTDSET